MSNTKFYLDEETELWRGADRKQEEQTDNAHISRSKTILAFGALLNRMECINTYDLNIYALSILGEAFEVVRDARLPIISDSDELDALICKIEGRMDELHFEDVEIKKRLGDLDAHTEELCNDVILHGLTTADYQKEE